MIFTVFSILSCAFDYQMTKKFIKSGTIVSIRFLVESQQLASMNQHKFKHQILFRKKDNIHTMGKILKIQSKQIDRLNPTPHTNGVLFAFLIDTHLSEFSKLKQTLHGSIEDQSLQNVCVYSFFFASDPGCKCLICYLFQLCLNLCMCLCVLQL